MKSLIFFLTLSVSLSALADKITLKITNTKGQKGKVFYAVLDDPKQFPDGKTVANGTIVVDGSQDSVSAVINVPAGSVAISTFLDVNGNGKMDKKLGIPSEWFGFSNNPKLKFGPPSFSECEVRTNSGSPVVIKVKPFKDHIGI